MASQSLSLRHRRPAPWAFGLRPRVALGFGGLLALYDRPQACRDLLGPAAHLFRGGRARTALSQAGDGAAALEMLRRWEEGGR